MPSTVYSWETSESISYPVDWEVDHYAFYSNTTGSSGGWSAATGAFTLSATKDSTSYTWTPSGGSVPAGYYYVAALDASGNYVGEDSDGYTSLAAHNAVGTSLTDIQVSCP
jgi:hypothetical protein